MMKWLDKIELSYLLFPAILLGLAPFAPMPHLVEKLGMLFHGELSRPIDIFDLFMHGAFPVLLSIKLFRKYSGKEQP